MRKLLLIIAISLLLLLSGSSFSQETDPEETDPEETEWRIVLEEGQTVPPNSPILKVVYE